MYPRLNNTVQEQATPPATTGYSPQHVYGEQQAYTQPGTNLANDIYGVQPVQQQSVYQRPNDPYSQPGGYGRQPDVYGQASDQYAKPNDPYSQPGGYGRQPGGYGRQPGGYGQASYSRQQTSYLDSYPQPREERLIDVRPEPPRREPPRDVAPAIHPDLSRMSLADLEKLYDVTTDISLIGKIEVEMSYRRRQSSQQSTQFANLRQPTSAPTQQSSQPIAADYAFLQAWPDDVLQALIDRGTDVALMEAAMKESARRRQNNLTVKNQPSSGFWGRVFTTSAPAANQPAKQYDDNCSDVTKWSDSKIAMTMDTSTDINMLTKLTDEMNNRRKVPGPVKPVDKTKWIPDNQAPTCMKCSKIFRPVSGVRRHHCRMCGRVFCDTCVYRVPLAGFAQPEYVCEECLGKYQRGGQ